MQARSLALSEQGVPSVMPWTEIARYAAAISLLLLGALLPLLLG
jgi:hypothetical protein